MREFFARMKRRWRGAPKTSDLSAYERLVLDVLRFRFPGGGKLVEIYQELSNLQGREPRIAMLMFTLRNLERFGLVTCDGERFRAVEAEDA